MRPHWRSIVLLIASAIGIVRVDSAYAEQPAIQCGTPHIQATYKPPVPPITLRPRVVRRR